MADPRHEVPQTIQSLPSIGAILLFFSGKDVNWWAAVLGMVFILVQLGYVMWKWRRDIRREKERDEPPRKESGRVRVAVAALTLSAAGLVAILTREDIKTEAYADPVHGWKVPTIGAGSTDGVKRGDTITPLGAVQRAHRETRVFEGRIKACMDGVELTQYEYDAYIRLAHNIGPAAFCGSTVVKRAKAGDYGGACEAILLFDRAGPVAKPSDRCSHPDNRTCRGLWRDRLETKAMCDGGTP